jgi:hypothetical protein
LTRQRTTLIALAALIAGVGASQLGSASADSTGASGTTGASGVTASDTIVVNGSDAATLPSGTTEATAQSSYQTALGAALTDAGQKATFIAQQIGATLGPITNVTETSDSSNLCTGPIMYAQGAKPTASTPSSRHKKAKHSPLIQAIIDPVGSCSVEADVTVTYAMTPA